VATEPTEPSTPLTGATAGSGGGGLIGLIGNAINDVVWLVVEAVKVIGVMVRLMLFIDARRLAKSKSDRRRYEGHGYFIWALALWMFAAPELYGAKTGKNGAIPTLSNTVGNLLNLNDWMSVFVVGLLFFGVAHVAGVGVPKHLHVERGHDALQQESISAQRAAPALEGKFALTAAESGRATSVTNDTVLPVYVRYERIAIGATAIAFLLPLFLGASKQVVGECGYATLFFTLFFVPGILAYRHDALAPFPGLFVTMVNLEKKSPPLAVILGAGLVFLAIHLILYPFPSIIPDIQGLHHHCQHVSDPALCVNPAP
jgi:hypothetical protein